MYYPCHRYGIFWPVKKTILRTYGTLKQFLDSLSTDILCLRHGLILFRTVMVTTPSTARTPGQMALSRQTVIASSLRNEVICSYLFKQHVMQCTDCFVPKAFGIAMTIRSPAITVCDQLHNYKPAAQCLIELQNVKVSDTTMLNSSNAAGQQKNQITQWQ